MIAGSHPVYEKCKKRPSRHTDSSAECARAVYIPDTVYSDRQRRNIAAPKTAEKPSPGRNFAIIPTDSENVRRLEERAIQREEARALWMRLIGHTAGFIDDALRLATLGCTCLELAEIIGNSAARQHRHGETMRIRNSEKQPYLYAPLGGV